MQKNFNLAWRNPSNNQSIKSTNKLGASHAQLIRKIVNSSNDLKETSIVICLSSTIIENKNLLNNFAENLEILSINNVKLTIVHDYANLIKRHLDFLGIGQAGYSSEVGSCSISDLLEMVISGHINKNIVSKLCSLDLQAFGFSGKDGNLIIAGKSITKLEQIVPDTDCIRNIYISEPLIINPEILFELEESKIIPIISPIASNEKGRTMVLDTNLTAAMIASSINAGRLIIMCEDDFLIYQVGAISSVKELDKLLESSLAIAEGDSLIRASRYILLNSEITVQFVDAREVDSLLFSLFG